MTRLFTIISTLIFITSCSDKTQDVNSNRHILKDTVLNFKTAGQNLELSFDSIGNVTYLSTKSDTIAQNIFFSSNGALVQIQNLRKDKIENTLDFNLNGQLDEIMWWNLESDPATNQYIRFCKSSTRSPIVDQNNSSVPMVNGFYKQLRVGQVEKIRLSGIAIFPSYFEVEKLTFDKINLEIEVSKKDKSELLIKCNKAGTYRLIAEVKGVFHLEDVNFKSDAQGQFYRIDLDITFK